MLEISIVALLLFAALLVTYKLYETGYKITTLTYLIPFLFACCGVYPSLQHHLRDYGLCGGCKKKFKKQICSEYKSIRNQLEYVDLSYCEDDNAE